MTVITVQVDDDIHRRLKVRAAGANLSMSALVRPLIEEAAYPGGAYPYTANDELLGIAIQTFTMVSALTSEQSPAACERAREHARELLAERGLLAGIER